MPIGLLIISFLLVLGPLIFLHELGHFLAAKRGGIRVLEFGIGYPPRALRLWRGKGYIQIDATRIVIPRNFKLPKGLAENQVVAAAVSELNGQLVLKSITILEDKNQPETEPDKPAAGEIISIDGQAVEVPRNFQPPQQYTNLQPVETQPGHTLRELAAGERRVQGEVLELDPGTEYTLNWLPLGGFTRMLGEEGLSGKGSFSDAPKRWRAITLLAGPGMNLLAALVVFTATYMLGYPETPVTIKEVAATSPAASAGLQAGDQIIEVGGNSIRRIDQIQSYVGLHAGQQIELTVRREGQNISINLIPRTPDQIPQGQGAMGVALTNNTSYTLVKYPVGQAVTYALGDIGDTVQQIVTLPAHLLSGLMPSSDARVMGPVGISQMAGAAVEQTAKTGEAFWILNLVAAISLALAITNLLPLPALDGGRLIFVLLEAIRRKRISPEREALVHLVGMALLLGLMVLITIQDIRNPLIPF